MKLLPNLFRKAIVKGRVELRLPDEETVIIEGAEPGPWAAIRITDPTLDWKIPLNPELVGAEAFMDGTLIVEDGPEGGTAYDLLSLLFENQSAFTLSGPQALVYWLDKAFRRVAQHNPTWRSKKNASHHYDLGNAFYRLWLDPDLQYSCAYYHDGTESLRDAQILKKRHIAAKLNLKPGQRVLDIGCGWGGMALYLAATADVEVTGITLAEEQLEVARARAKAAGLEHRARFELLDYRDVTERYDRIVSVGMLEHVGVGHLETYFHKVRDCLKDDGVALIHTISSMSPPAATGPFLRKYIFPGGYTPTLSECAAATEAAELWVLDCEVWRIHYARTLRAWQQAFQAVRGRVEEIYDPRFARMWEFYLAACECSFAYGSSNVLQLQLGRERDATPLHRDWIPSAAAALAQNEPDAVARIEAATRVVFGEASEAPGAEPGHVYSGPREARG